MSRLRSLKPSRAMAVALFAVFLNMTGLAYAASGGNFILGQANTASTQTTLTRNGGKSLQITNTSTSTSATPLGLTAGTGRPPFVTNSQTRVDNLNADLLDGLSSSNFYILGQTVADSSRLGGHTFAESRALASPQVLFDQSFKGVHTGYSGTFTVNPPDGAGSMTVLATVTGSVYAPFVTSSAGICLVLSLNGGTPFQTTSCAKIAINEANSHKALVALPTVIGLSRGTWTATLTTVGNALTNNDDYYNVSIMAAS